MPIIKTFVNGFDFLPSGKLSVKIMIALIYAGLAVLLVYDFIKPMSSIFLSALLVLFHLSLLLFLPWVIFYIFHIFVGATEGLLVAGNKARMAIGQDVKFDKPYDDYFIARRQMEMHGGIKMPAMQIMKDMDMQNCISEYEQKIKEIDCIGRGIRLHMYKRMSDYMTPEEIDSLAYKLNQLRLNNISSDTIKPVSERRFRSVVDAGKELGAYDIINLAFDMTSILGISSKELAQWFSHWFPAYFNSESRTAATYLFRVSGYQQFLYGETSYSAVRKPTKTVVPTMTKEEYDNAREYFCALGKS